MNVFTNETILNRRISIAKVLRPLAFATLIGGLILLYLREDLILISWMMAGFGYLLSIVAAHMGGQYLELPSRIMPFTAIPKAIKGTGDSTRLYQLYLPANHVLTTPSGVYVIKPRDHAGTIVWNTDKNRFEHRGERMMNRIFGIDRFGKPDKELTADINSVSTRLEKYFGEDAPMVKGIVLLTNPQTKTGSMAEAPYPVLKSKGLKKFLREQQRGDHLSKEQLDEMNNLLGIEG